jgi:hypothetical protein
MQPINFRVATCRPYALLQCPLRTGAKRPLIDGANGAVRLDSPQKVHGLLLVSNTFVAYAIPIVTSDSLLGPPVCFSVPR